MVRMGNVEWRIASVEQQRKWASFCYSEFSIRYSEFAIMDHPIQQQERLPESAQ